MSITTAREIIQSSLKSTTLRVIRHHKYAWIFTIVAILAVGGIYFRKDIASAATYTFTQGSWAGVMDGSTANHTSNQTGWTKYSAVDASVTAGTTVALANTAYTATDDGTFSTTGSATGGDFDSGTFSNTSVMGSGSYAAIQLGTSFAQISNGYSHTCALKTDGTVYCWGYNGNGQLGDNTTTQRNTPVQVCNVGSTGGTCSTGNLTGVSQISVGQTHTCALKTDGTVYCWGVNGNGQLGDNTSTSRYTPVKVCNVSSTDCTANPLTGVSQISAGQTHTCALKTDGTVYCWGNNAYGRLGNNTTTTSNIPVKVCNVGSTDCTANPLTGVFQISAGGYHTCALKTDGTSYCWGYNQYGQLGDNTNVNKWVPVKVCNVGSTDCTNDPLTGVSNIDAGNNTGGYDSTCTIKTDGTVYCWGYNGNGQLGDGTTTAKWVPVKVCNVGSTNCTSDPLTGVSQISAGGNTNGYSHTCAIKTDGTVYCWGYNSGGQLGNNTATASYTPVKVCNVGSTNCTSDPLTGVSQISAGGDVGGGSGYTCALKTDGTSYCWGLNTYGNLGDNTTTNRSTPVQVLNVGVAGNFTGVSQVTNGFYHTCALKTDGTVYCWGDNSSGGLGDNSTTNKRVPVQVLGVGGSGYLTGVSQISAGGYYTCALKTDGTVYCWGSNGTGQLGDNTTTNKSVPVKVCNVGSTNCTTDPLTGVSQISAGYQSNGSSGTTCALKTDGTAYCWGLNGGQLGDNTTTNKSTPVKVCNVGSTNCTTDPLTGVSQISIDYSHTCAVKTDGTVYCWGYNNLGQLGDNTIVNKSTPVQVCNVGSTDCTADPLTGVSQIREGLYHTCALKTDGTSYCWGRGGDNALGNNTTTTSYTPVKVCNVGSTNCTTDPLTGVSQIIAGERHSCALKTDGTAYCWGSNSSGQLGDNTTTNKSTPVKVCNVGSTNCTTDPLTGVSQMSGGDRFTCAVKTDGTAYCWGGNNVGQLGDNTTTQRNTPVQVFTYTITGYLSLAYYTSPGAFTSASINLGGPVSYGTVTFNATLNSQTITIKARSDADGDFSNAPAWSSCSNIASGGSLTGGACVTSGHQYIQYQATFSTADSAQTPNLNDISFNYSQYQTSGTLTSSIYNTEAPTNVISRMSWTGSGTTATEIIKFQIRSSPDGAVWSNWCGMADTGTTCAGTNYFTESGVSLPAVGGHPLNTGGDDQYFQYKLFLSGSGGGTPTVSSAIVQYVVNAPPQVANVSASQGSNGTVTIGYDVSDTDTINNSVDITLQYCPTGSTCVVGSDTGWINAVTVSGNVGASVALGTGKSIVWTPTTDYASQYNATEKIRVKANDGDAANNFGYGISTAFILDTMAPVVGGATIDSSGTQDIVNLTTTDNSAITYRLCNSACSAEGWTAIASATPTPISFSATGAPNAETVYFQVRDAYGNTTTQTVVAPATPTNFLAADVSNPAANSFGETLSWLTIANAVSYKIYSAYTASSSVPPTSYTLLANPSTNVYQHTIITATTSAYWYRIAAVNVNGDVSNFSTEMTIGDVPDSFGTTLPDTAAPTIDTATISIPTATLKNTSAVIIFTTNELAIAKVYYGTTNYGTACSSYGIPVTTASYVTAQSVSLTGLTASTPYYYCLKAVDTLGNPLVDPNTGVDGSAIAPLTTAGGPTITVAPQPNPFNDTSATIIWTTSTSSDSYVYYATNASVTNSKNAGSATLVSCVVDVCQHQVGISGLTAGTKYYYYVKSTDGLGNTTPSAIDNFTTTIDITAPVITGIATPVISSTATVIVWQTDEPSTSQVLWGATLGDRSKYTATDDTKSIYHVVTLSSATTNMGVSGGANTLTPSTPYYYVVKSADVAGNTTTSAEQTVTTTSTGNVTVVAVSVIQVTSTGATPDTTPPVISNVKVSEITPFAADISFNTSEDAVSFVEYGKDTSYGNNAGNKTFGANHTIKLRGLTLGSEYHIKVSAIDKAGNTGTSDDQTFKTTFLSENIKDMTKVENIEQFQKEIEDTIASILPSLIPPFVGKPQIADITEDSATISFTTNIKSFPVIGFVEENLFDETKDNPYSGETSDTTEKRLNHTLALLGLKPNTTYHIQARAFSLPQVIGKSKDHTFTTKASKIVASIVERKKDSFTVVWTTTELTSSIVEYKNLISGRIARVTDDIKKLSHAMKIENLPSATSYEVNVSGINEKGNMVEAGSPLSVMTSKDITPPTLSSFKVANALVPGRTDRIQTIISWVTDEPSDSIVYYEEGVGTTGDTKELANIVEVSDLSTNHNVILSSLKPGAIYRIKITSADDSGNTGSFGPRTVITPRQTESITDIIFKNFEDSFKFLRQM